MLQTSSVMHIDLNGKSVLAIHVYMHHILIFLRIVEAVMENSKPEEDDVLAIIKRSLYIWLALSGRVCLALSD